MPRVFRLMEIKDIQQTGSSLQLETCNLQPATLLQGMKFSAMPVNY